MGGGGDSGGIVMHKARAVSGLKGIDWGIDWGVEPTVADSYPYPLAGTTAPVPTCGRGRAGTGLWAGAALRSCEGVAKHEHSSRLHPPPAEPPPPGTSPAPRHPEAGPSAPSSAGRAASHQGHWQRTLPLRQKGSVVVGLGGSLGHMHRHTLQRPRSSLPFTLGTPLACVKDLPVHDPRPHPWESDGGLLVTRQVWKAFKQAQKKIWSDVVGVCAGHSAIQIQEPPEQGPVRGDTRLP